MQKVVIDTNVIISAHISKNGNPAKIIELLSDKKIMICYNEKILAEYKEVLSRIKFKFPLEMQNLFIMKICELGFIVNPKKSKIKMPDESDRIFFDTAKSVNAYLITGNTKHYPEEEFIMTPAAFLQEFLTNPAE